MDAMGRIFVFFFAANLFCRVQPVLLYCFAEAQRTMAIDLPL